MKRAPSVGPDLGGREVSKRRVDPVPIVAYVDVRCRSLHFQVVHELRRPDRNPLQGLVERLNETVLPGSVVQDVLEREALGLDQVFERV